MKSNRLIHDFIHKIDVKKWNIMSPEERLDLLQEFENVMAKVQGRDAYPVKIVPQEIAEEAQKNGGILQGYFSSAEKVICINSKFLTSGKSILGVSSFNMAKVLETIAHEGRHAWQHYVIEHPEKKLVDRKVRISMMMNMSCYVQSEQSHMYYQAQLIELDARRYAREILQYIGEKLEEKDGHLDMQFVSAIRKTEMGERILATRLLKDGNMDEMSGWEEQARKIMALSGRFPGVDFTGAIIFEDAKSFLLNRDASRFVDGPPIAVDFEKYKVQPERPKDGIHVEPVKELQVKHKPRLL